METGEYNQLEVIPEVNAEFYQYDDPTNYISDYEPWNYIEPVNYMGTSQSLSLNELLPFSPCQAGYMINAYQSYAPNRNRIANNMLPYRQRLNCFPRLFFPNNSLRIDDNLYAAYYGNSFVWDGFHGNTHHNAGWGKSRLIQPRLEVNNYALSRSNVYNGWTFRNHYGVINPLSQYFYPLPTDLGVLSQNQVYDCCAIPGYNVDSRCLRLAYDLDCWSGIGAANRLSNVSPLQDHCLQQCVPLPIDRFLDGAGKLDENYINKDPCRNLEASFAESSYTPKSKVPIEQTPSQELHCYKDESGDFSNKSAMVCPTVRASESTGGEKQSDQAQQRKPAKSSRSRALPTKRSRVQNKSASKDPSTSNRKSEIQKAPPAPRKVWREKTKDKKIKDKASASQTKERSLKHTAPIYHLTWDDGFDDGICEPVGQECVLCDKDLSEAPPTHESLYYDDLEPTTFPAVAVLPCGHAFHSNCLELNTPDEELGDPPCFLCLSYTS